MPELKPDLMSEQTIVTHDRIKKGQASIADKITALVMWAIIPFAFIIILLLVNSAQNDISASINDDAEMLLNSARILLAENNSYNSPITIKELQRKLKKSIYCKINFSTGNSAAIVIKANECRKNSRLSDKKYFFSTLSDGQLQELRLVLSHPPEQDIIIQQRSNVIIIMIVIIFVLGIVLTLGIRLLLVKPLLKMIATMRLISEGKHDLRLNLNQDDELGYLAKYFNKMLDQTFEQQKNLQDARQKLLTESTEQNRIALELRTSRDQLEELLEERTADLAIARNETLKANKGKSLFLANICNEIRVPLSAILGYSQLLYRESGFTKKQLKSLKIIEESGTHLSGLLNNILDIAKIEAGKMELNTIDFDLNQLLHDLSREFYKRCSKKGLFWHELNELSGHVFVHSDRQKLRQILFNLLECAVKSADKGDISLRMKMTVDDQYLFEISVRGTEFVSEAFKDIYTAFYQGQKDADIIDTELGLVISRKYLELLGADLKLSAMVAEDRIFSFSLKLKTAHSRLEIRQESNVEVIRLAPSETIKALVVDNIELSRNLLIDMLVEMKTVVHSATNGLEAIEFIQEVMPEDRPEIAFMDIRMPVMNGIEAVKRIKKQYGDAIICVAVTASTMNSLPEKYFQAGFDDYISKPYRFETVLECMKKHWQIDFEY